MAVKLEIRHLQAVVVLGEELNFTRAAQILRIGQPALSKQINEVEEHNRLKLFTREKGRIVDLTDAGRAFVEHARVALFHAERAIHLARAAQEGAESVLLIGHSHYADRTWISALLAIRLPLFPKLRVRLVTRSAIELAREVLRGELNIALVTAPPEDPQITKVPFARTSLYVALPRNHRAARKEHVTIRDLKGDDWVLPGKNVHPIIHDAILRAAQLAGIAPKDAHDVMTAHQAVHLVSEHVGIAIIPKPAVSQFHEEGVVLKPLSDPRLWFETCLIMRAEESSRVVNDFARAFLRQFSPKVLTPKQMELPLPA
ncbi:MAG TPA: LysR substrate-binding domain-containing protein [Terriglobales bacterium]|nr:LysR substrate-binding domain-containing protein [Terriglobales bacterium]